MKIRLLMIISTHLRIHHPKLQNLADTTKTLSLKSRKKMEQESGTVKARMSANLQEEISETLRNNFPDLHTNLHQVPETIWLLQ